MRLALIVTGIFASLLMLSESGKQRMLIEQADANQSLGFHDMVISYGQNRTSRVILLPGLVHKKRVWVTSYSPKYAGRQTRAGSIYNPANLTCAVPRPVYGMLRGKWIRFSRGKYSALVRVTDSTGPGIVAYDLSARGWKELYPGLRPGRERAFMEVVK